MTSHEMTAVLDVITRPEYDPRPDECWEIDEYLRLHDLTPTEDQADE